MTFDDDFITDDDEEARRRHAEIRLYIEKGMLEADIRYPLCEVDLPSEAEPSPAVEDVSAVLHFTEDLPVIENRAGY